VGGWGRGGEREVYEQSRGRGGEGRGSRLVRIDEALRFTLVVNGRSSAGMYTHLHLNGVSICTFVLVKQVNWEIRAHGTATTTNQLLVYEALTYLCMRPSATSVCSLQLLVSEAFSY